MRPHRRSQRHKRTPFRNLGLCQISLGFLLVSMELLYIIVQFRSFTVDSTDASYAMSMHILLWSLSPLFVLTGALSIWYYYSAVNALCQLISCVLSSSISCLLTIVAIFWMCYVFTASQLHLFMPLLVVELSLLVLEVVCSCGALMYICRQHCCPATANRRQATYTTHNQFISSPYYDRTDFVAPVLVENDVSCRGSDQEENLV